MHKDELIKELVKSASEEAWEGNCKHSDGQSSLANLSEDIREMLDGLHHSDPSVDRSMKIVRYAE